MSESMKHLVSSSKAITVTAEEADQRRLACFHKGNPHTMGLVVRVEGRVSLAYYIQWSNGNASASFNTLQEIMETSPELSLYEIQNPKA